MDPGNKYRPGRHNKTLQEIAKKHGYTPGEFTVMRVAKVAKQLKEWQEYVDKDIIPPELAHLKVPEAQRLIKREIQDLISQEEKLLPYFYPRMSNVESQVDLRGEVSLIDLLKSRGNGGTKESA